MYYEGWSAEGFLLFIHYLKNRDLYKCVDRQIGVLRIDKHAPEADIPGLTEYRRLIIVLYYHICY